MRVQVPTRAPNITYKEVIYIEIWKDVVGYEGLYKISNFGNVKSLRKDVILSPGISQGYYYVALYKDGVRRNKQVNRLVAEAFLDNKNNYPLVHHKDEVKLNNRADNLEWQTYEYNNTYNDVGARRGEKLKGHTAWNKGKTMTESFKQKVSSGMRRYYQGREETKLQNEKS